MKEGFGKRIKGITAALALATMPHSDTPRAEKAIAHTYAERTIAAEQLARNGITDLQRTAYKPGISEALEERIMPFEYAAEDKPSLVADIERVIQDSAAADKESRNGRDEYRAEQLERAGRISEKLAHEIVEARRDAWAMYLGLPQSHDTFGISQFKPTHSTSDIYYYRLNHFLERFEEANHENEREALSRLLEIAHAEDPHIPRRAMPDHLQDVFVGVMGHFTLTAGEDAHGSYISYYDRWDLEGSTEGKDGLLGRPFEIYDRIYYDPKTIGNQTPVAVEPSSEKPEKKIS